MKRILSGYVTCVCNVVQIFYFGYKAQRFRRYWLVGLVSEILLNKVYEAIGLQPLYANMLTNIVGLRNEMQKYDR